MNGETIVCRCEDVTQEEILQAIKEGATSLEEVKRLLRCGMGLCQGRGCMRLIAQLICKETGKAMGDVSLTTSRPPLKPVPLDWLARSGS